MLPSCDMQEDEISKGSESSSFRPKRHPSGSPDAPNKKRPPVGGEAPLADSEDAITQDEIHGAELPSEKSAKPGKIRNACRLVLPDLSGTSSLTTEPTAQSPNSWPQSQSQRQNPNLTTQ